MDDPSLDAAAHGRALRGLRRLNRVSRSAAPVWGAIRDLAATAAEPLRVLDLATGGGDAAVGIARLAERDAVPVHVAGCDVSPVALDFARRHAAAAGVSIDFFRLDALRDELPGGYDVITCSLFVHHVPGEEAAIGLLRKVALAARRRVVVSDLHRSPLNYAMVYLASRLVTRSPVVHADGPRSVRAAFTADEALHVAHRAGLDDAAVRRCFPSRFLLTWSRS